MDFIKFANRLNFGETEYEAASELVVCQAQYIVSISKIKKKEFCND